MTRAHEPSDGGGTVSRRSWQTAPQALDAFTGTCEIELHTDFQIVVDSEGLRPEAGAHRKPATITHFDHDSFLLNWGRVTSAPLITAFTIEPYGIAISFEEESLGLLHRVVEPQGFTAPMGRFRDRPCCPDRRRS